MENSGNRKAVAHEATAESLVKLSGRGRQGPVLTTLRTMVKNLAFVIKY